MAILTMIGCPRSSSELESLLNATSTSFVSLIGSMIAGAITLMIDSMINDNVSNNYLIRYGTLGYQEKNRYIKQYMILVKTPRYYNQLRHYKHYKRFSVLGSNQ